MNHPQSDVEAIQQLQQHYTELKTEIAKIIVGQNHIINGVIQAILCNGHSLLVGVPGLAKTLLVNTLSQVMDLSFNRIQFTPDLMPSDITGAEILDQNRQFKFLPGPIFSNIILADEINRTPPKTQAALLEAMQERHITLNGQVHQLPSPFFVLATQNPIEQEGTYPLPEAQLDRFMFNLLLEYPTFAEELQVVKNTTSNQKVELKKIITATQILQYQNLIRKIPIADNVLEYAVTLTHKTRPNTSGAAPITNQYIAWGAGPRASQFLVLGAKCHAALNGKYSPDIEDVKAIAPAILRHRIIRNFKAEAEGVSLEKIIQDLL